MSCRLYLKEGRRLRAEQAAGAPASARIDAYSLQRLDDLAPLFNDVYAAAVSQGLPAETLMFRILAGAVRDQLHRW